MRLLIKLRCLEKCTYEMQYHYYLQGFIYNLLKGTEYGHIHDKKGHKFFCFSNIFPVKDLVAGDLRTVLISSPNREFIEHLNSKLEDTSPNVVIGSMKFTIDYVNKLDIRIPNNNTFSLITGTPVIVRIPKEKYNLYGINPRNEYDYLYWRTDHPIELFVAQIQNNLSKKYNEYNTSYEIQNNYKKSHDEVIMRSSAPAQPFISLFEKFRFIKQISTKLMIRGSKQIVIGSIWEFRFEGWEDSKLIQFALDSGLGERNSLGFGFMNIKLDPST